MGIEFSVLSTIFVIGCSISLLWREHEVNRMIRDESKDEFAYDLTVKERTTFLMKLTGLMYIVVAPAIFVAYQSLGWYDGPWWLPFVIDVPALIAGLYTLGVFKVTRHIRPGVVPDETNDTVSMKDVESGSRSVLATIFVVSWPFFSAVFAVLGLRYMDLPGLTVMTAMPLVAFVVAIGLTSLAPRF